MINVQIRAGKGGYGIYRGGTISPRSSTINLAWTGWSPKTIFCVA